MLIKIIVTKLERRALPSVDNVKVSGKIFIQQKRFFKFDLIYVYNLDKLVLIRRSYVRSVSINCLA